ncbi:DNA repair protein RadA [Leadbettera azotonutricia]|uniref:DNA repair protein RadA n=1 Tax=Leadbettera azotonutricia (strain ATCC BAA-888 / DSM 13862 / ZAS-9) TaxID=545695 RepID=F5YCK9_LEAAZ|nr:DNA repair protein RadA [Leadbettera azotonutricia]AEF81653.1 DNA repair protein RadA [Leadbettera azotonutricia ZAS-9]
MKKQRTFIFKCSSCGHEEPKWLGRCPECGEWNTLTETPITGRGTAKASGSSRALPQSFPLSSVDPLEGSRIASGIGELDRVLGGGIMKSSAILVGGEPGIGKSTLLLQAAAAADTKGRILYISGEESAGQIRMRADRLGIMGAGTKGERIEIFCSGNLEEIQTILEASKPVLIIVDSAQTLFSSEAGLVPGTINQMKYCSWDLISWVKEHDAALFLVAHVTKDGLISGPKSLEHMVDTVLYFEGASSAASDGDCRFLRAAKNRFGSVDEIGIFTMGEKGLSIVEDPSLLFLVRREGELPPGVATAAVLEGSRTLLVEIQALTVPAKGAMSRVFSDRIDSARVSRVAATIEKHLGLRLSDQDLYINVAGGIRIAEVGVELALACAIYSARTSIPLPAKTAIAGELSLAGEVRPLRRQPGRVKAARNLGFDSFLGPAPNESGTGYMGVHDIKSAIKSVFS